MKILGISAYYHDSAAALVEDGKIIAAAQEERFTRKKHDEAFPQNAVQFCLAQAGIGPEGVDAVAFYEKPLTKFARLLETYLSVTPKGLHSFMTAMPTWLKEKLWIPLQLESAMTECGMQRMPRFFFPEHHYSHAASAFYPSPFESAAVMTIDGVGEWSTTTLGQGNGHDLKLLSEMRFPHSLGLLYSAFTYFTGFRVNSGEYKLMGLAPYGEPKYVQTILDHLMDLKPDGSFRLNMNYFGYLSGLRMTNARFASLFGGPERKPESDITARERDLARSIQVVTEEVVMRMARHLHTLTGEKNLCLAGGVALNCVCNGKLQREGPFERIWIQPAAGDAGGALGAALAVWHQLNPDAPIRKAGSMKDEMQGAFLGPRFPTSVIREYLDQKGYPYQVAEGNEWADKIAELIDSQKVIGLFQGRMEFGPRALGGRSIIGDARSTAMQSIMNLKIKYRESFRPFAPSCLEERVADYFEMSGPSPYMLLVADVKKERCFGVDHALGHNLLERINQVRSDIPAVTHVDYSARIQTVTEASNPRYYSIIKAFESRTGCAVIINTSFNVRGEPIVGTPEDAYRCFMRTEMDVLVLEDCILVKENQPAWHESKDWRSDYKLD
jgi:carbamoyltransferase